LSRQNIKYNKKTEKSRQNSKYNKKTKKKICQNTKQEK